MVYFNFLACLLRNKTRISLELRFDPDLFFNDILLSE